MRLNVFQMNQSAKPFGLRRSLVKALGDEETFGKQYRGYL